MKTWLINWWDVFRTSFWFVPTLLALTAVALAWLMPWLDRLVAVDVERWFGWVFATAPAARLSLSSIAGAMITVTGVVFSITIVALANTATQFGSRLLRTFMEDVVTHFALGSLLATGLYCLLVLRIVQDNAEKTFVPHLSVALGILGAILSMGVFIYFIHHIAMLLQAPNLVHSVAADMNYAIERLYPEKIGSGTKEDSHGIESFLSQLGEPDMVLRANKQGYLQAIDHDGIIQFAAEYDLVFHLCARPGTFLSEETPMAYIWRQGKKPENYSHDETEHRFMMHMITGRNRTPRQDVEFAVQQVVEVTVRALSPGVNDPFTAMTCVDYLGSAMAGLASRRVPTPFRCDGENKVRIVAEPVEFSSVIRNAFRPILHFGRTNPMIYNQMLVAFKSISLALNREQDKAAFRRETEHIVMMCEQHIAEEPLRIEIIKRCRELENEDTCKC